MNLKYNTTYFLTFALIFLSLSRLYAQQTIYVAPGDTNGGQGTREDPYPSIQAAVDALPGLNKNMEEDIEIYLREGVYRLSEPIVLDESHSGSNGFEVIFKAYENEKPIISGGTLVTGWKSVDGTIYQASLKRSKKLRSLFVNGQRKRMAGTEDPIPGLGDWGRYTISGDQPWSFGEGHSIEGIKFATSTVSSYRNPDDIELVQFNVWTEKILCAREFLVQGDTTIVKLQQPYGAIATSMAWAGKINYDKNFVIRNAYELLDTPGEFYFDKASQILYYYSDGEDMTTADVIAPTAEGLFQIHGTSRTSRVKNLRFEGITFSHDDWGLMEVAGSHGFAGIQSLGLAVKFIPDGNWHPTQYNSTGVPTGAIDVKNAENVVFDRNRFEGINSAIAINLVNDVVDSRVSGNYFYNNLGNAVSIGHPQHYKIGDGALYGSEEEGVCRHIDISNNYLRSVCLDFRQVEGITAFFVEQVNIHHNDIRGTPYGAITVGWWWGNAEIPPSTVAKNNTIAYNRAGDSHQVLDDGGIIYALGEQPDSYITRNYVFNGPRCIYPDDGSAYWTITDNVVGNPDYKMWLHLWSPRCHDNVAYRNYVKNNLFMDNGTDNIVTNTLSFRDVEFSETAQAIIDAAGISEAYRDIMPEEEPETIDIFPAEFKERDVFH